MSNSQDGITQPSDASHIRRSLAEQGVIVMKESRTVARVPAVQGSLDIAGQVIVIVKNAQRKIHVGVKLEQPQAVAFVDSDEIDELLAAMVFIASTATGMGGEERDYTEISYSTRDSFTIGFYQEGKKQQVFVRLGLGRPHLFFGMAAFPLIREAIVKARDHVSARRADWEGR